MKTATTRFVFDRKHTATKDKKALVQIEILFERKKKYVSTGVKVYKNQWHEKHHVCNTDECVALNERLHGMKGHIDDYLTGMLRRGEAFTWQKMEAFLGQAAARRGSFIDWVTQAIETRHDIRETTRRMHRKLPRMLERCGILVEWEDLTKANVLRFDDFLHGTTYTKGRHERRPLEVASIHTYHRLLKTYINEAIRRELTDRNPYAALHFDRGEGPMKGFLTEEELRRVAVVQLPTVSLRNVRDLFLFQCYTGLAYSDMAAFSREKVLERDGRYILSGERVKTGKGYYVVLLPQAVDILERYGWRLPVISNEKYNAYLKVVAQGAGIDKPVSSHYARRTAGMILLNSGMPVEVVAKVLGHSSSRTTEKAYAKILDRTVEQSYDRLMDRLGRI